MNVGESWKMPQGSRANMSMAKVKFLFKLSDLVRILFKVEFGTRFFNMHIVQIDIR